MVLSILCVVLLVNKSELYLYVNFSFDTPSYDNYTEGVKFNY